MPMTMATTPNLFVLVVSSSFRQSPSAILMRLQISFICGKFEQGFLLHRPSLVAVASDKSGNSELATRSNLKVNKHT
jgi:hypothetical protein